MAPPKKNESNKLENEPFWNKELKTEISTLDPRHGVFPNLVMTPLFSTLLFIQNNSQILKFINLSKSIIYDSIDEYKFNVWKDDPTNQEAELNSSKILTEKKENEFWISFGYSTYFALLLKIINGDNLHKLSKKKAERFGIEVSRKLFNNRIFLDKSGIEKYPKTKSAQLGCFHHISINYCEFKKDSEFLEILTESIFGEADIKKRLQMDSIMKVIPILHNEAYQNVPFGHHQNCFILKKDLPKNKIKREEEISEDYFFEYIGKNIFKKIEKYL